MASFEHAQREGGLMASTPRVTIEKLYPDASGAPGTVVCDGHYFAADYVGEPRLTSLTGRSPSKRTIARAYRAYVAEVRGRADRAWFDANRAMYPGRVSP